MGDTLAVQEVVYIISKEERAAFEKLTADDEREKLSGNSGIAAIPHRVALRIRSRTNITAGSHTPTSVSSPPSTNRAGKPAAAELHYLRSAG